MSSTLWTCSGRKAALRAASSASLTSCVTFSSSVFGPTSTTESSYTVSGNFHDNTRKNTRLVKRYSRIGDMYRARRLRENSVDRLPGLKRRSFRVWKILASTSKASRFSSQSMGRSDRR